METRLPDALPPNVTRMKLAHYSPARTSQNGALLQWSPPLRSHDLYVYSGLHQNNLVGVR